MLYKIILGYLLIINMITFIAYGVDKYKAGHEKWRIPEATLIGLAIIGGSIGALLGMRVFHHKTRKPKFFVGVPVILALQIVVGVLFFGRFFSLGNTVIDAAPVAEVNAKDKDANAKRESKPVNSSKKKEKTNNKQKKTTLIDPQGVTLAERIKTPGGFERTSEEEGSLMRPGWL